MYSLNEVDENFKFLVLEVIKQLDATLKALENPNIRSIEAIQVRDGYIDNLKTVIENKCFSRIVNEAQADKNLISHIRAIHIIANNLEKIGDYFVSIVGQIQYLNNHEFLQNYNYKLFFNEINSALNRIEEALLKRDIAIALKICKSEFKLDELFGSNSKKIMSDLLKGDQIENLITVLFIFRYLERAGDALLNIGEAIIFSIIGEKIKINQFQALENTLSQNQNNPDITHTQINSIWGGRSGCRISKVSSNHSREVLFKDGNINKLCKEKENLEYWEQLYPGLTPKIFNYQSNGQNASIIVEYLFGSTLQHLVLDNSSSNEVYKTIDHIKNVLNEIWNKTKKNNPIQSTYLNQLSTRLNDVYMVHPDFEVQEQTIASLKKNTLDMLLKKAYEIDHQLSSPFSVFIHGDFNINNIIYNTEEDRIHFIDVYRSCEMDYIQDISVFLISNFRLPVFEKKIREKINHVILDIYHFAKDFAHQNDDKTFMVRLTLGLIRSFMSSTRFELNKDFAKTMQLRAIYLLEKLVDYNKSWSDFKLTEEVLIF